MTTTRRKAPTADAASSDAEPETATATGQVEGEQVAAVEVSAVDNAAASVGGPPVNAAPASSATISAQTYEETPEAPTSVEVEAAKNGHPYLNVTGAPLMFDELGHMVDGGAWTPAINLDKVGRSMRDAGHLRSRSSL